MKPINNQITIKRQLKVFQISITISDIPMTDVFFTQYAFMARKGYWSLTFSYA
ncbi:hypothetical protein MGAS2096_Spy0126 [Streptococcus pyogenes MGAS2096]|nr:hypothetical protein MGAS2096_Spy0126 [Streptococcus pyogenes MGAS2096]